MNPKFKKLNNFKILKPTFLDELRCTLSSSSPPFQKTLLATSRPRGTNAEEYPASCLFHSHNNQNIIQSQVCKLLSAERYFLVLSLCRIRCFCFVFRMSLPLPHLSEYYPITVHQTPFCRLLLLVVNVEDSCSFQFQFYFLIPSVLSYFNLQQVVGTFHLQYISTTQIIQVMSW